MVARATRLWAAAEPFGRCRDGLTSDPAVAQPGPPRSSYSIASQVIEQEDIRLDFAVEIYAKLGIALADAFISCWDAKYRHNVIRPVTYLRRHLQPADPTWLPILLTPPFPEYTSGHSVQSGAMAEVLEDLLGDDLGFTDHTHGDRGFSPRSFASFAAAADEAAISRLYGGIHYLPAIELGVVQGRKVGAQVNALRFASRRTGSSGRGHRWRRRFKDRHL